MFDHHTNCKAFSWSSRLLYSHWKSGCGRLGFDTNHFKINSTHNLFGGYRTIATAKKKCTKRRRHGLSMLDVFPCPPEPQCYRISLALAENSWGSWSLENKMKVDTVGTFLRPRNWESNDVKENTCVELGRGVGKGKKAIRKHARPMKERKAASPIRVHSPVCLSLGRNLKQ